MTGLLALAFGAGLLAPVNPCGFGLLPAVLTATTATRPGTGNPVARLAAGLRAGLALTAGFTGTFTAIGLLLTVGVRSVITLVPWLAAALGAALALAGIAMLAGWHPAVRIATHQPNTHQATSTRRLVTFGAGYAIASASCTLAVLLAVITQAAATTWVGVLAVFTAYAAGSALLLVTLALFAATAATLLTPIMRGVARYASRLAGRCSRCPAATSSTTGCHNYSEQPAPATTAWPHSPPRSPPGSAHTNSPSRSPPPPSPSPLRPRSSTPAVPPPRERRSPQRLTAAHPRLIRPPPHNPAPPATRPTAAPSTSSRRRTPAARSRTAPPETRRPLSRPTSRARRGRSDLDGIRR
ncbi:MAG: hypothetical protein LC749_11105 [Actinobacteria bacterium]|nr:hypothetical protein [Actinomycetota bacterium]